jgi:hypothetical protein
MKSNFYRVVSTYKHTECACKREGGKERWRERGPGGRGQGERGGGGERDLRLKRAEVAACKDPDSEASLVSLCV